MSPEPQRVGTPLVEGNVVLEPPTPHAMNISTFIQRTWSLLFGRRKNTLRALYANNGGALGIAPISLTDMKYEGTGGITSAAWIDVGKLVDVIAYHYFGTLITGFIIEGSVDGTNPVCLDVSQTSNLAVGAVAGVDGTLAGVLHARVRYIRLTGLSAAGDITGAWAAYSYIDN